jgi:hypothetical protein
MLKLERPCQECKGKGLLVPEDNCAVACTACQETGKVMVPRERLVLLGYRSDRGNESARLVEPFALAFPETRTGRWLLHAWDFSRGAYRTFAMENVITWSEASLADLEMEIAP